MIQSILSISHIVLHEIESDLDQDLPTGLPRLQILVHPPDILQLVSVVDLDVELAIDDELEQFFGVSGEFFSGDDIVEQGRTEETDVLGR